MRGWAPVVILGSALVGCGATAAPAAPVPPMQPSERVATSPSAVATDPVPPAPAPDAIAWRQGVDVLERARAQGRPAMAWFRAEWSASSVALGRRLEASEPARRAAAKLIAVVVDLTETSVANEELAARYAVDHVPTILVLDAQGRTVRLEGEIAIDALVEAIDRAVR